jgi:hypothetical protein
VLVLARNPRSPLHFALAIPHLGREKSVSPDDKPPNGEMSDELDEIQADVTNGQSSQIESDEAFCARMRAAIEAGLENAPIGVVTTPGTKHPKYVSAEPLPLGSWQREMEHA